MYGIVDSPTTEDLLGFEQFAVPIAERIATATEKDTPLTIGIYGEWGSGKTSFLLMVDKELRARKIHPIWFNAWKYDQEENLWSALIQTILDQAVVSGKWHRRVWVKAKLWARTLDLRAGLWGISKKLVPVFVRTTVFLVSAGVLLGCSVQEIERFLNRVIGGAFSVNPLIAAWLVRSVVAAVGIVSAKPDALIKLFDAKLGIDYSQFSRTASYREHIAFLDEFSAEFQEIIGQISLGRPVVVIIDDLDRCMPEKAVQVLEAVKLFLDVENCVFLLAVDREVVERAISVKYKDLLEFAQKSGDRSRSLSTFLGENYFEKVVQLPFALPPISKENVEQLILNLCSDEDAKSYAELFAIGLPRNPRKVKRVLQIYLFLRALTSDRIEDGSIHASLLAKMVIIQNQFRSLYARIVDDPRLLGELEGYYRAGPEEKGDFLETVEDPVLREKIEAYSAQYMPVQAILLQSSDERDTFCDIRIEDYIFFLRAITEVETGVLETVSEQEEEVVLRRYLSQLVEAGYAPDHQLFVPPLLIGDLKELNQGQQARAVRWEQVAKRSSHIAVLGSAGSGKTTLMRHIARSNAKDILQAAGEMSWPSSGRMLFPIMLSLGRYRSFVPYDRGFTPATFIEFVRKYLDEQGVSSAAFEIVLQYLERGGCILLLDGLDEAREEERYLIVEGIKALVARYPANRYVLSMRSHAFDSRIKLRGFTVYEIAPWNVEQALEFIRLSYESADEAERLISRLESSPKLGEMTSSPLFLSMLVQVFNQYGSIPGEPGPLIDSYVDLVTRRWDLSKGIRLEREHSVEEIREVLGGVAQYMREHSTSMMKRAEIIDLIVGKTGRSSAYASELLSMIVERGGLLREIQPGAYMFVHRLLLDYFANPEVSRFTR
jgi:Cdc6-like AAA superfamily ATPase